MTTRALTWVLPAITAAGLGMWRLTGASLWADELATWGAVRLSWDQLRQLTGSVDVILLPYYGALHAYTKIAGTGTTALRLPSVIAVTLTALAVVALGRRAGGDRAGLAAGMLFALLPVVSRYAQEARPYALVILFAALALLALVRLLEGPTVTRTALYTAAVAGAGLAHPLGGMLMVAGHAVAVPLVLRPWKVRTALLCMLGAGIGSVPALLLAVRGQAQSAQISWITLVDWNTVQGLPQNMFVSAACGGILLALAVLGVRRPTTALAAAAFVPPVLLLVVGVLTPIFVPRYALVALPALAALAGAAAVRAGRPQAVAVLALTAVLAYPVHTELRESDGHGQDSARIAAVIGPRWQPGDVVVFPDRRYSIPWAMRDIYERYLPAPRPPDVLRVRGQREDGTLLAEECPEASCLGTPNRIWVVGVSPAADLLTDMTPAKRKRIEAGYRVEQRWGFKLLAIALLERRP
ncbi:glycosyltransferase family 39 protein [Actinoplanes rectilineatus]|uniref:glycosyltransferase family 39 protein n=1 Tax=Actinoplanes rectilineatus TaxID=113571 RepID=UPI0005F2BA14|nr:glycosyltransferase family 39 protein [Actinoplanes rectilineatus]